MLEDQSRKRSSSLWENHASRNPATLWAGISEIYLDQTGLLAALVFLDFERKSGIIFK